MKPIFLLSLYATLTIISCKTSTREAEDTVLLNINFESKSNSTVTGQAELVQNKEFVSLNSTFRGLSPEVVHAIHIHEKADCSAADATSTGGHWNPTFENHGKWGSASYHRGDIGNFTADANGNGTISMTTDQWCIGCDDPKKDILGKALIVHEKADDFTTQPTGNAGARIACSGIIH